MEKSTDGLGRGGGACGGGGGLIGCGRFDVLGSCAGEALGSGVVGSGGGGFLPFGGGVVGSGGGGFLGPASCGDGGHDDVRQSLGRCGGS